MFNLLTGVLFGLLSATLSESYGHQIFGHPSERQLKIYKRFPRFFAPFLRCYYHHAVVHHQMTFQQDILTQFQHREEKSRIDDWLMSRFPESFVELIWRENYNLTLKGLEGIVPFALPFAMGPMLIAIFLGPVAFLGSIPIAVLPLLFSKYLHPVIHAPLRSTELSWLARKLCGSRYARWVLKNHYLHHLHVNSNFNLLLGGDYLRGVHRAATSTEAEAFSKLWEKYTAIGDHCSSGSEPTT